MSEDRFLGIDILRGFAALSVLVYHVIEHTGWTTFPITGPLLWFRIGWLGVPLFFVISGFVIMYGASSLYRRSPERFLAAFAINRIFRIYPLYLATIVLFLVLVIPHEMHNPNFLFDLLTHLGFVHNLNYATWGSINGVNWTIATEMQFYLALALLLPILIKIKPVYILFASIFLGWTYRYAAFHFVDNGTQRAFHLFVLVSNVPGSLDLFGFGIALARFISGPTYRRLATRQWFGPAVYVASGAMLSVALKVYWLDAVYWPNVLMVTFFPTLIGLTFCLLILAACQIQSETALRWLAPFRYLGIISYGIYLWHLGVILIIKQVPDLTPITILFASLAVTLALSMGSWHFLEQPTIRVGREWLRRIRDRSGVTAATQERGSVCPVSTIATDREFADPRT